MLSLLRRVLPPLIFCFICLFGHTSLANPADSPLLDLVNAMFQRNPALIKEAMAEAKTLLQSDEWIRNNIFKAVTEYNENPPSGIALYTFLRLRLTGYAISEVAASRALIRTNQWALTVQLSVSTIGSVRLQMYGIYMAALQQAMSAKNLLTPLWTTASDAIAVIPMYLTLWIRQMPGRFSPFGRISVTDLSMQLVEDLSVRGTELELALQRQGITVRPGLGTRRLDRLFAQINKPTGALKILKAATGFLAVLAVGLVCKDAPNSRKFFDCAFDTAVGISPAGASEPRYKNGKRCEGSACD